KLLEQGNSIPRSGEGDAFKDGVLLEYYIELSNFYNIMPFEDFLVYKLKSDVVKAVSFFLFAYDQPSKHFVAGEFLDNAARSVNRLSAYYFSKHDVDCLQEVNNGLSGLRTVLN
ncbi:MAG: hypothetical protein KKF89_03030, partial [Nanoarchaeota archaeon]|nr:hypothetical protein [Nanoarchaeota archaeon]MBU1854668.1 hypothetical protein [Nanoarchaeota archaeon]